MKVRKNTDLFFLLNSGIIFVCGLFLIHYLTCISFGKSEMSEKKKDDGGGNRKRKKQF